MLPAEAVRGFRLTSVPPEFLDDPYPWYAALREHDPVHELESGSWFVSRYDDAIALYRDPRASSDKKVEFRPKFGDSPLFEYHTTSLVFNGPIQLNNRRLTAPMSLAGKTLAEGALVTIGIGAANRDPRQFPDPDRFDAGRKPNRHVGFGQGDHACAGMNVARMEARVAFERLLPRFARIEFAGEPVRDRRVRFRGFRNLPVRLA
jgi:cytochrome P450